MNKVIGWIGVGSMGSRMAANLSKAGYPLIIADKISTESVSYTHLTLPTILLV